MNMHCTLLTCKLAKKHSKSLPKVLLLLLILQLTRTWLSARSITLASQVDIKTFRFLMPRLARLWPSSSGRRRPKMHLKASSSPLTRNIAWDLFYQHLKVNAILSKSTKMETSQSLAKSLSLISKSKVREKTSLLNTQMVISTDLKSGPTIQTCQLRRVHCTYLPGSKLE